jgi:hypothetical protein
MAENNLTVYEEDYEAFMGRAKDVARQEEAYLLMGIAYGRVLITPFAKNGTWEGRFSTHVSPDGIQGKAVVHGTGELMGMKQYNNMSNSDPNDPCHTDTGYILLP